ncbi:MAG: hypothetical protein ABL864_11700 [Terricaulis sp.]|jgi:hypothetical protein
MSDDLDTVLDVLRASKKLKRSREQWVSVLSELCAANIDCLLDRVAPVPAAKKAPSTRIEDPLVADVKERAKQIKGSAEAKINALERTPPFANVVDRKTTRKAWPAAVRHWRQQLTDEAIREGVISFVAAAVRDGRRSITLSASEE